MERRTRDIAFDVNRNGDRDVSRGKRRGTRDKGIAPSHDCKRKQLGLLNHLVGAGEQHGRYSRPSAFDHQFEFGGRLHRKIARLGTFENAIDMARSEPILVRNVDAVGCQSTLGRDVTERVLAHRNKRPAYLRVSTILGSRIVKVEPQLGSLSTVMSPPII
jgi:hypothetical protein